MESKNLKIKKINVKQEKKDKKMRGLVQAIQTPNDRKKRTENTERKIIQGNNKRKFLRTD